MSIKRAMIIFVTGSFLVAASGVSAEEEMSRDGSVTPGTGIIHEVIQFSYVYSIRTSLRMAVYHLLEDSRIHFYSEVFQYGGFRSIREEVREVKFNIEEAVLDGKDAEQFSQNVFSVKFLDLPDELFMDKKLAEQRIIPPTDCETSNIVYMTLPAADRLITKAVASDVSVCLRRSIKPLPPYLKDFLDLVFFMETQKWKTVRKSPGRLGESLILQRLAEVKSYLEVQGLEQSLQFLTEFEGELKATMAVFQAQEEEPEQ